MDYNNNKQIEYGISELHFSIYDSKNKTFSTPKILAAAAAIKLNPISYKLIFENINGENYSMGNDFFGYDGTLSIFDVSLDFLKNAFDYEIEGNGLVTEKLTISNKQIALLYTTSTNRVVYYNCKIERPDINLETKAKQTTIAKLDLNVSIRAHNKEKIRSLCYDKSSEIYKNWFSGSCF